MISYLNWWFDISSDVEPKSKEHQIPFRKIHLPERHGSERHIQRIVQPRNEEWDSIWHQTPFIPNELQIGNKVVGHMGLFQLWHKGQYWKNVGRSHGWQNKGPTSEEESQVEPKSLFGKIVNCENCIWETIACAYAPIDRLELTS